MEKLFERLSVVIGREFSEPEPPQVIPGLFRLMVSGHRPSQNDRTAVVIELHSEHLQSGIRALAICAADAERSPHDKIMLVSPTWDDDPREIFQIPEARQLFLETFIGACEIIGLVKTHAAMCKETLGVLAACANPDIAVAS